MKRIEHQYEGRKEGKPRKALSRLFFCHPTKDINQILTATLLILPSEARHLAITTLIFSIAVAVRRTARTLIVDAIT